MTDERPTNQAGGSPESEAGRLRSRVSQHLDLDALSGYLDDALDTAERAAAAAHLTTCPDCRRELAELRATVMLLRGLPQFVPRRSFRLGPEHAREPKRSTDWFARLLPALPTLRAATVVVAVLLVAVTIGDLVANRGGEGRLQEPRPSLVVDQSSDQGSSLDVGNEQPPNEAPAGAVGTEPAVASSKTMGDGADSFVRPTAPAAEVAHEAEEAPAPADADGAERSGLADETREDDAAAGGESVEATAPTLDSARQATPLPAVPTANALGRVTEPAGAAGGDAASRDETAATARARPSGWRLAQFALGLTLLWLIVGLVGAERLGRRVR